jgi:hypothetical protein
MWHTISSQPECANIITPQSSDAFFSMTDAMGIVAGIGPILKTLTSAGIFLQNIDSASREAQEVASQVHATEAILKSLQASLQVLRRPQEFHDIWGDRPNWSWAMSKLLLSS